MEYDQEDHLEKYKLKVMHCFDYNRTSSIGSEMDFSLYLYVKIYTKKLN